MSVTEDNNSMQTHDQKKDGGFRNYLLGSLGLLRRTNTMSKLRFCCIRRNSSEMSVHPSAGLCALLVPFNPFCSCTPSFNFHSLIYFCPTVPELVPNVYRALVPVHVHSSCSHLLSSPSPFSLLFLSYLISQSLLFLILLSLAQLPKSQIFQQSPTSMQVKGIISKMTSNSLKSCCGIWYIYCICVQVIFTARLVLPTA